MESENNNYVVSRNSIDSTDSSGDSPVVYRKKTKRSNFLFPRSLQNRLSKKSASMWELESIPSEEPFDGNSTTTISSFSSKVETAFDPVLKDTTLTIILVEAKGLPEPPDDGSPHGLYCKIRLGSKTFKSKTTTSSRQPEWRQKFELQLSKDNLLRISLWDKGKQKIFMGSCVIDLSDMERDRTHKIWQPLDDGYGSVHISLTMCNKRTNVVAYNFQNENYTKEKYALHNLTSDWTVVGELHVKVVGAKGLSGRPSAYCSLEVDNQKVQTHSARAGSDPIWQKSYTFDIYDITSSLDLNVYDSSLVNQIRNECLGRLSIPLLRITNSSLRWYALKDRSKRKNAKGNYPRILLDMSIYWNPVKAAVRLFQPKEKKYIEKPPKFDFDIFHNNMKFVADTLYSFNDLNEVFKRLFEWDSLELSFVVLLGWLIFWYYITLWVVPLFLLIPFLYHWIYRHNINEKLFRQFYDAMEEKAEFNMVEKKNEKPMTKLEKLQGMPEMTSQVKEVIDYIVSQAEKLNNLASFKVPFLSYLAMLLIMALSLSLYLIPFNYLMMALGIYKFTRKYLNPNRKLNNDFLDFLSRVPDNAVLRDWTELSIPEALRRSDHSPKQPLSRSISAEVLF